MSWLHINWFDFLLVVVLLLGVHRGRKRGMSAEFTTMVQWLIIMLGGAFLYAPAAAMMSELTFLGLLFCNVVSYLGIAGGVKVVFVILKKHLGEKLDGSDAFGRAEYYLGMISGLIRFFCVLMFALALLNAKDTPKAQSVALAKMQKDNFGDITLIPTWDGLQQQVFKKSLTGKLIGKHLDFLLLEPTKARPPKKVKRSQFTY